MVYIVDEQEDEMYYQNSYKIRGNCEICGEPIVLGDMTLHKSGKYLCALCQIYLNKGIEFDEVLRRRRKEIMNQLSDIDSELGVNKSIGYV